MNPSATIEEIKKGYIEEKNAYTCLLCGESIEKGIIYPYEHVLLEAEKRMKVHIEETHESVFHYLLELDKKMTGLTEHQTRLLTLFYQGKKDKEIQTELEIGSVSTIRHHRFMLKEKERQAKNFLALMELLKEKDDHAPSFVPIHQTATMIDDRYNITEDEQQKIVKQYFQNGKLMKFPIKQKQKLMILREIVQYFPKNQDFTEKELNQYLQNIYDDYVLIRRYLIEYGFLDREADGSRYWLK